MDDLLTIGAFSRATLISAKALRAYHERGLLIPAAVDPYTGYRGYRAEQLAEAAVIRELRSLDMPLAEIAAVLGRDPEQTKAVLRAHRDRLRQQLSHTERILDRVSDLLAAPDSVTALGVTERYRPATTVLSCEDVVDEMRFAAFLDDAYPRLFAALERSGLQIAGPPGAAFPEEFSDQPVPVTAFVPVTGPVEVIGGDGVAAGVLPAADLAVATYIGPYEDIAAGYLAVGAWLAGQGRRIAGRVTETYVLGPGDGVETAEFRTEIGWPVRPAGEDDES